MHYNQPIRLINQLRSYLRKELSRTVTKQEFILGDDCMKYKATATKKEIAEPKKQSQVQQQIKSIGISDDIKSVQYQPWSEEQILQHHIRMQKRQLKTTRLILDRLAQPRL